jgi:hypothetical protein
MVTAIAFQLSAALENYQALVDDLANPWSQRKLYERLGRQFDQVRMLKGAFPDLSVPMVEVLICHVELMKALWSSNTAPHRPGPQFIEDLRRKHREAVKAMREKCLRVFSRS